MITKFSEKTKEMLGYYVYVYADPDTHDIFYVGKGKDNRVFDHITEDGEGEKHTKLKMLHQAGKEPLIDILVHGIDNSETAELIEMAVIDALGKENLTNQQRGKKADEIGRMSVEYLEHTYSAEELNVEDFTDEYVLLKISKFYKTNITPFELYEIARASWKVGKEAQERVKYAMPVYNGIILEVYEIAKWLPANSTWRSISLGKDDVNDRAEFVGKLASDDIRKKYVNKSVKSLIKLGDRNPVRYIVKNE